MCGRLSESSPAGPSQALGSGLLGALYYLGPFRPHRHCRHNSAARVVAFSLDLLPLSLPIRFFFSRLCEKKKRREGEGEGGRERRITNDRKVVCSAQLSLCSQNLGSKYAQWRRGTGTACRRLRLKEESERKKGRRERAGKKARPKGCVRSTCASQRSSTLFPRWHAFVRGLGALAHYTTTPANSVVHHKERDEERLPQSRAYAHPSHVPLR